MYTARDTPGKEDIEMEYMEMEYDYYCESAEEFYLSGELREEYEETLEDDMWAHFAHESEYESGYEEEV